MRLAFIWAFVAALPPRDWGAITTRENKVYVHVLEWKDPVLAIPPIRRSIRKAIFALAHPA